MANTQPPNATTDVGPKPLSHRAWSMAIGAPSTDIENPDPARLYELLDTLVALRVEFADGAEGERAISGFGRAKVLEVRTVLDMAIVGMKRVINEALPLITMDPLI
jgi:hypothetical protein